MSMDVIRVIVSAERIFSIRSLERLSSEDLCDFPPIIAAHTGDTQNVGSAQMPKVFSRLVAKRSQLPEKPGLEFQVDEFCFHALKEADRCDIIKIMLI